MNYAIILAGGVGSRFWPLSRESEPKQFLNLCSNRSMLEDSIHRVSGLVKRENIYIATNRMHTRKIKDCLKEFALPLRNILFEPEVKNSFAPIGVLSKKINDMYHDAVVTVLPCDHFIRDIHKFWKLLNIGMTVAKQGYIVTLGITPVRAETGYGYIRIKSKINPSTMCFDFAQHPSKHPEFVEGLKIDGERSRTIKTQNLKLYKVDKFIEKPNLSLAKRFIRDKRYYWNSGVFIFKPGVMLEEIKSFMPKVYKIIMKMKNKKDIVKLWHRLPAISVDYAIMERTKKMVLLPANYTWIDMGGWQAIEGIMPKDREGNIFRGNCIDVGSKNIIGWSDNRLLATLGLDNIIIVNTKDALLVCSKDKVQDVKKLVSILRQKNFKKQI